MGVTWPSSVRSDFGTQVLCATHDLHTRQTFCDEGLADLLDRYPRDQLGIWTFGAHGEGEAAVIKGQAPHATGTEIVEAVKRGAIWLNLRKADLALPELQPLSDEIFTSLEEASGQAVRKRDMGLLISSPNVHVHYHLDIPLVALFQLRGQKRLWLYPADEEHAPSHHVEAIVRRQKEEGLPFRNTFEAKARAIDLEPGMAVTWPQTAPHRVQNGDCLNVSLSCEYMTLEALVHANAIYTNAVLRRRLHLNPQRTLALTPASFGKAALARLLKLTERGTSAVSPTAISFELDVTRDTCIRQIETAA